MDMKDFTLPPFDPRTLKDKSVPFATEVVKKQEIRNEEAFKLSLEKIIKESQHVLLVMVGLPGSGKSTIVKNLLLDLGFDRISRDELKSMDKCEKKVSAVFAECPKKKKVLIAIDNTSHDMKSRKKWLDISKKFKASSVAVHIDIDKYHAIHNNMYRFLSSSLKDNSGEPVAASVPPMVIFKQANEFEPPTEKEGFDFVFKTRFTPTFSAEGDEELYFMFLSEK
ncbi:Uncharacterized protein HDE_14482 [Halotydeus destructor]|nr:Uncharacterized protein HDE_14482 [Halotydeus destructor]